MHRHKQTNAYKNYFLLIPSNSTSSRKIYNSSYDLRLRTQQSSYLNTTPISTYSKSRVQHQYQPSTTVSNLVKPSLVLDNQKSSKYYRPPVTSLPLIYKPPNSSRQSSTNDDRLATASVMREHLLENIQRNISEIDQELSSLKKRSSMSNYVSPRFPPIVDQRSTSTHKKISLAKDDIKIWPNTPKKIYQVVPRITNEIEKPSQQSTLKLNERIISNSVIGQYHYAPETQEIQILENDPENSDLKSTFNEISRSNFHETFSLNRFCRQQSDLPENRALIFVPQYVDNYDIKMNELTEEFQEKTPIDINFARSSTVTSLHDLVSSSKLNIQDFQLLIQTAPDFQVQNSSENYESFNKIEQNLNNTILSKPVKHSHLSIKPQETLSSSSLPMKNPQNHTDINMNYFFGDIKNDFEGEEDLISIDPYHFVLPFESEFISDDNRSNTFIKQPQASLLNHHTLQQQQTIENNTQYKFLTKIYSCDFNKAQSSISKKKITTVERKNSTSDKMKFKISPTLSENQYLLSLCHHSNHERKQENDGLKLILQ
ncbi:unnamed protein product [Rotaria sp. Silwood1]|nr:unnamed protein product [Rotaria sp. Silwood1]